MRKKRRFKQENKITYNVAKPNRQARRLGVKAELSKEEQKENSNIELRKTIQTAKEIQKRITPKGMTYGEYMEYFKSKQQEIIKKHKPP